MPARRSSLAPPLLGALLGAGLVGLAAEHVAPDHLPRYEAVIPWAGAAPAAPEWPRPAGAGETARTFLQDGRSFLVVRSTTAAAAAALARDLRRRRLSGVDASFARRARLLAGWRAALVPGPLPPLSPAAECAALLRGRLLLIALADTARAPAPPAFAAADSARRSLARAESEVERGAQAQDPAALSRALTDCATAEGAWLEALAGTDPAAPGRAWSGHERSRAPELERLAGALESGLGPAERAAVPAAAQERAFQLERLAPEPAAVLFVAGGRAAAPSARPLARTWVILWAAGALAGGALGLVLGRAVPARSLPARARSRAPAPARGRESLLARTDRSAREAELSWLHVVSGADPRAIGEAAARLGASFVERGERVLIVDAGRKLRLHERFGGEARWGLLDCLAGEAPLLGAVQSTGREGLYLLARGTPGLAERWEEMSRVLEDAQSRFGRVILAIGPRVPREAALPLGGRVLEAWWVRPGARRGAIALSERLGIAFTSMEPEDSPRPALALAPAIAASSDSEAVAEPAAPVALESAAESGEGIEPRRSATGDPGSTVIGADGEVRERLRFLLWMRRLQAEQRSAESGTRAGG
ncbi:MAG TPA: hypothetical protein VMS88_08585 [Terriglobales bacterium]|nr:hypothetical protein [Terriglobales bacterium]